MSALILIPDLETGSIRINVEDAANAQRLVRADGNGTHDVRVRTGTFPFVGTVEITDYEPALTGDVTYRLYEFGAVSSEAWTSLAGTELPRFVIPSVPQFGAVVEMVTAYTATRESRAVVHQIIGRPDPIIAQARLSPRTGSLDVWCSSYIAARDVENIFERGQTVMYRQVEHVGMDMYFSPGRTSITTDEDYWKLTVEYVEVGYPAGAVISLAGWTFKKLATDEPNFEEVTADYRSFLELTIGEAGT